MQITTRHSPSFAVARVALSGGESVSVESGAMMGTSAGVELESKIEGGMLKGLKRSVLGGESLFLTRFTAPSQGGWIDCAPRLPGDLVPIEVNGAVNLTRGSWLCSSEGVEIETKWGGFKNLAGGEGGFLVRAEGSGTIVAACYGALDAHDLAAGESQVLDSGHLVAFSDGTEVTTRKAHKGIVQSLKSGEGLVMEFTGPRPDLDAVAEPDRTDRLADRRAALLPRLDGSTGPGPSSGRLRSDDAGSPTRCRSASRYVAGRLARLQCVHADRGGEDESAVDQVIGVVAEVDVIDVAELEAASAVQPDPSLLGVEELEVVGDRQPIGEVP